MPVGMLLSDPCLCLFFLHLGAGPVAICIAGMACKVSSPWSDLCHPMANRALRPLYLLAPFWAWLIPLSILYKTKLPFIVVFNKTDVQSHQFALEWMTDFEAFQEALASHQSTTDDEGAPTYMNSLMNSMSLVLDEFYKHLKVGAPTASRFAVGSHFPSQLAYPV